MMFLVKCDDAAEVLHFEFNRRKLAKQWIII